MKKIIYRILWISFTIIAILTIKSYAASEFTYTIDSSGNATITAYNGLESNLTIPSTIEGHNVISIGEHAFDESRNSTNGHTIKNVIISEGIQKIELLAFTDCENLESVKLPESLTFLDMLAFLKCNKLKSINIPSKIENIPTSTFQENGFTEFDIPENVKFIGSRALGICSNLEKVRVYSKDIKYDIEVFYRSPNLVLYGYEGSTTQEYAQKNGIQFKLISDKEDDNTVTSISLNKTSLSLYVGDNETLSATILPDNVTNKTLIWTSSNPNVATVEDGKVIAKSVGSTIITVSNEDGTKKVTCNVTVNKKDIDSNIVPITTLSLNKNYLSLYTGNIENLIVTILPNNATDKDLVWTSSNSNIATVENGKVTAKSVGSAIITVSNIDGTKKATCNVTVNKRENNLEKPIDNTIATGKLPQTGIRNIILILLISISIIMIILYRHYRNLKDI